MPDIGYSHVIRGHIFLNQGKTAEALAAYRTATARPHTLPWQQAIAYDRLGRLYAAQGDTTKALEHYDKAMTRHRDLAVVHTNKAHLLDQLGKHQEALDLYRQALQLNPDDPLTALLLRDAERRQQLAQDREQQQRIDQSGGRTGARLQGRLQASGPGGRVDIPAPDPRLSAVPAPGGPRLPERGRPSLWSSA